MKRIFILSIMILIGALVLLRPDPVLAQGATQISIVALDEGTFVTVQETGTGDILSLYRIKGERIVLIDSVFNGSSRDINLSKRYLHRMDVENR